MQKINDFGPLSVFAKELRACGGRFFLGAPAALLSILLMPVAIICDFSPFVQILILLWNLSLVMNQVLTVLGLVACLESTGFSSSMALAGTLAAAILAGLGRGFTPLGLPLMVLAFLVGGFSMGLGRWLYYRGRDLVLFGPQLVIHALGQVVRQSLEFVLSGALANDAKAVNIPFRAWVGPREDRPFERYQSIVNLRTVVWGVGLFSLMLNLFALANLDFLNVLLLLPSLMFSVSTLVGPFLLQPKPGKHIGPAVWGPKVAGWFVSFGFYMLVARLISYGGWLQWVGVFLCVGLFSRVLLVGLKYVGYPSRLRKLIRLLARQIAEGGLAADEAQKLAQTVIRDLDGDLDKTKAALQKTSLPAERQKLVLETFEAQVVPLLRRPVTDIQTQDSARRRFISEWNRSFVLGLFTFLWFFVVPLPGLLVFTAPGGYRVSMSLAGILDLAVTAVGVVLASGVVSLLLEQRELFGLRGDGLLTSVKRQYESFLLKAARLSPVQMSRFYAMFTEIQTHFDQRSYAFAWRTLRLIETDLKEAEKSD